MHSRCRRRPAHGIVRVDDGLGWLGERASMRPGVAAAMPTIGLRPGHRWPCLVRDTRQARAGHGLSDALRRPGSGWSVARFTVACGLKSVMTRAKRCSWLAAGVLIHGPIDGQTRPSMRRRLAVARMLTGRRLAQCRPLLGPPCAAGAAAIGRCHAWYWPGRCSLPAAGMPTVGRHDAHGRPQRCHPSALARPSIGRRAPLSGSRCRPVPTAPLFACGLAPATCRAP
jgi:hypothetical protein